MAVIFLKTKYNLRLGKANNDSFNLTNSVHVRFLLGLFKVSAH